MAAKGGICIRAGKVLLPCGVCQGGRVQRERLLDARELPARGRTQMGMEKGIALDLAAQQEP